MRDAKKGLNNHPILDEKKWQLLSFTMGESKHQIRSSSGNTNFVLQFKARLISE